MTTTINASTSSGLVQTADTSGALAIQTANTTAISISAAQVVTLANALPVASGGTGTTTSTGSGNVVLSTSPTLVTPVLGTPTSGTLTNCTGLPLTGLSSGVTGVSLGAGDASLMKNRIINGGMVISQRNGTTAVNNDTTGTQYSLDRWGIYGTQASKFSAGQYSTAPTGFNNSIGISSNSSYTLNGSDTFWLQQQIEGYNVADLGFGTSNAKTVTLSFWVRSSLTGTFGGTLRNADNSRCYPYSYTISVANTWEQKSITITGCLDGTWGTTNGSGIKVLFSLGSNYLGTAGSWTSGYVEGATGQTSLVGTSGANLYVTGVQLEVGSSATGYEYRQYGQELALCQRYYTKFANNSSTTSATFASGNIVSSTDARVSATFPTTMRTSPTINYSLVRLFDGNSASAINSITQNQATTTVFGAQFGASAASFTIGRGANIVQNAGDTTSYIDASAEL